jgi:hypothetical protein
MFLTKIAVLVGTLLCLATMQAYAMSCDECKELEANIAATDQELKRQEAEIERAYQKKDLSKITQNQKRLAEISRKLLELKKQTPQCKDACRPDVVKRAECGALLAEIAMMESDAVQAQTSTERIDAKYKALLNCHQELEQLTREKN